MGVYDYWWALADLNRGPKDYENRNSAATPLNKRSFAKNLWCVDRCAKTNINAI